MGSGVEWGQWVGMKAVGWNEGSGVEWGSGVECGRWGGM